MKLQASLADLKQAGLEIVAISYDSAETLKEFSDRAEIEFPLLSDTDSQAIDAYGIRNREVAADSPQQGIPHPGTFVVDEEGIVRAKLFYSIRVRHTPEELINSVQE